MIARLIRILRATESGLLVFLLALMIGVAAYQVAARNIFDSGLLWGDGLVRVLVLWITLVGAMLASRRDEHIRMDVLTRLLDNRWNRRLQRGTSVFTSLVCAVFAYHAGRFVLLDYQDGMLAFASVPAWACEIILPLGGGVLSARYFLHAVKSS